MNRTLKTFLRSVADTGRPPEAIVVLCKTRREADVSATGK